MEGWEMEEVEQLSKRSWRRGEEISESRDAEGSDEDLRVERCYSPLW